MPSWQDAGESHRVLGVYLRSVLQVAIDPLLMKRMHVVGQSEASPELQWHLWCSQPKSFR